MKMEMRRKDREVTDINEIEKILLQCKICHVAMTEDGTPYVVPLSYGYKIFEDNTLELYFHRALEGEKIEIRQDIVNFVSNPEMLMAFMCGWTKYSLETRDFSNK